MREWKICDTTDDRYSPRECFIFLLWHLNDDDVSSEQQNYYFRDIS